MRNNQVLSFVSVLSVVLLFCNSTITFAQSSVPSQVAQSDNKVEEPMPNFVIPVSGKVDSAKDQLDLNKIPLSCINMPTGVNNYEREYCFFGADSIKDYQDKIKQSELNQIHADIDKNLAGSPSLAMVIFIDRSIFNQMTQQIYAGTAFSGLGEGISAFFDPIAGYSDSDWKNRQDFLVQSYGQDPDNKNMLPDEKQKKAVASATQEIAVEKKQYAASFQAIQSGPAYKILDNIIQRDSKGGTNLGAVLKLHGYFPVIFSNTLSYFDSIMVKAATVMVHESSHALDAENPIPTTDHQNLSVSTEYPMFLTTSKDYETTSFLQDIGTTLLFDNSKSQNISGPGQSETSVIRQQDLPKPTSDSLDAHAGDPHEVFAYSSEVWFEGYDDPVKVGKGLTTILVKNPEFTKGASQDTLDYLNFLSSDQLGQCIAEQNSPQVVPNSPSLSALHDTCQRFKDVTKELQTIAGLAKTQQQIRIQITSLLANPN